MRLTLFSLPKPFTGTTAVIQRNAIRSWVGLGDGVEILLMGDDHGVGDASQEFGVRHVPHVQGNELGTPLVSSIFEVAQGMGTGDVFCYVNADIILLRDTRCVLGLRLPFKKFLLVGRRWDITIDEDLDFGDSTWSAKLMDRVQSQGKLHDHCGMDYFIFPRGLFKEIPRFAIGRTVWDNWLAYRACQVGGKLIDATGSITAIHQDHDYAHIGGLEKANKGPEFRHNRDLLGNGVAKFFDVRMATHVLTPQGVQRRPFRDGWKYRTVVNIAMHSGLYPVWRRIGRRRERVPRQGP